MTHRARLRALVVVALGLLCPGSFVERATAEPTAAERTAAEPTAAPPGLDAVLAEFRKSAGLSATFVEEKRILLLKEPLRNEGRIFFQRPATFVRFVDKPFPSKVLLQNSELSLTEGETTRVIDLNSQPAVRALVGGFLSLLQADSQALTRDYQIAFESHADGSWKVVLTPKGAPIDKLLRELSFTGSGATLTTMRWVEKSGDTSETRFSKVELGRVFSDAEKAEYFSPPAK